MSLTGPRRRTLAASRRLRRGAAAVSLVAGALFLGQLASPAGAQGVPTATSTPTRTPRPAVTVTFRCPGVTAVSIGADLLGLESATATPAASTTTPGVVATRTPGPTSTPARVLSPVDAAESPCILQDAEPDFEWSLDHYGQRMTAVGTWRQKLRTVLEDFDLLHAQYVANPRVKDIGMWPARMQETLELTRAIASLSHNDRVYYYALALDKEYKQGIYDERPLLTSYALQARQALGDLTADPTPVPARRVR